MYVIIIANSYENFWWQHTEAPLIEAVIWQTAAKKTSTCHLCGHFFIVVFFESRDDFMHQDSTMKNYFLFVYFVRLHSFFFLILIGVTLASVFFLSCVFFGVSVLKCNFTSFSIHFRKLLFIFLLRIFSEGEKLCCFFP